MEIKRYEVVIVTPAGEDKYSSENLALYIQDGLVSDSSTGVTAAVVEAKPLLPYHGTVLFMEQEIKGVSK